MGQIIALKFNQSKSEALTISRKRNSYHQPLQMLNQNVPKENSHTHFDILVFFLIIASISLIIASGNYLIAINPNVYGHLSFLSILIAAQVIFLTSTSLLWLKQTILQYFYLFAKVSKSLH